jgi:hypothetical protein
VIPLQLAYQEYFSMVLAFIGLDFSGCYRFFSMNSIPVGVLSGRDESGASFFFEEQNFCKPG